MWGGQRSDGEPALALRRDALERFTLRAPAPPWRHAPLRVALAPIAPSAHLARTGGQSRAHAAAALPSARAATRGGERSSSYGGSSYGGFSYGGSSYGGSSHGGSSYGGSSYGGSSYGGISHRCCYCCSYCCCYRCYPPWCGRLKRLGRTPLMSAWPLPCTRARRVAVEPSGRNA